MSSNAHVYMGPYVQATPQQQQKQVKLHCCPKEACTGYGKASGAPFCKACGSAMDLTAVTKTLPIHWHSLVPDDVFFDFQHEDQSMLYLGSNGNEAPRKFLTSCVDCITPLADLDVNKEINWFYAHHATHLAVLKHTYTDLIVTWGVHVFYM